MLLNSWGRTVACLALGAGLLGVSSASMAAVQADSPYIVEQVPEEWLPQSSVIAITQARDGYLWLGTLNGLVRFDGIQSTWFTEANTPDLNSSQIVCLYEDSRSNLWVGTSAAGIAIIGSDGSVRSLKAPGADGNQRLVSILEDASGTVWLNTADGQVARYQQDRLEVLSVRARPITAEKSGLLWLSVWVDGGQRLSGITSLTNSSTFALQRELPARKVDYLLASKSGGFWCLSDGRVQKWTNGRMERDLGPYLWGSVVVTAACEDSAGNLIVGTQGAGVFWYDSEGKPDRISGAQGLSHDTVLSLCMDREGDLWVGTDGGGLNRVRRRLFGVQEGSLGLNIRSVSSDGQGGLWFANFGGKLNHLTEGRLDRYGVGEGLLDSNVRSVLSAGSNVWVGTTFWGIFRLNGAAFQQALGQPAPANPFVSVLWQGRNGLLWAGTQAGLGCWNGVSWKIYSSRDGLPGNDVRAIAEDSKGALYIGTAGQGLARYRDGRFASLSQPGVLSTNDSVSSLFMDESDVLWIGTSGGLVRFNGTAWTSYGNASRDSILKNRIGYLLEDGQGYLWIGSYAGLMRAPKKSLNDFAEGRTRDVPFRVYGKADGLPTRECAQDSQPAACRTPDGKLWFATIKGLVSVDPSRLKPNPFLPPVVIESVLVDGQEQNTNALCPARLGPVTLPANKERLDIQYTSLNLAAPDRAQFRYRLEGRDSAWTDAGGTRVARYSNLPPGRYRFHVIAGNEDGQWNETGASLGITVLPPFWRTWWFLSLNSVLLLSALVVVVRYVSTQKLQRQLAALRQQEALDRERARIARDLHDQLGANLTQVSLLSEMAEADRNLPDEVGAHARQIAQTARETTRALDEIVWAANPLNDTLEGLITYACKYAQDYFAVAGLSYRLDAPMELPPVDISPGAPP